MERSPKSNSIVSIDFEDTGDWWEFRRFLSVKQQRTYSILAITMQQMDIKNPDFEKMEEITRLTDELGVMCTVAWSYGPVDMHTFETEVPNHHWIEVSRQMGDLYIPLLVKFIENGLKNYSLLSKQVSQSQTNSSLVE